MKHEEIWHTCDRCGAKLPYGGRESYINEKMEDFFEKEIISRGSTLNFDRFFRHRVSFELCKDCTKKLGKFLKGE